jgi:DNA polymerase I-like protein with 3'-5' exonuclease and polymerase domains
MIRVKKRIDREGYYRMLLQVHDSIVGEAKMSEIEEIKARVIEEMTNVAEEHDFGVKFTAEADFWGPKIA